MTKTLNEAQSEIGGILPMRISIGSHYAEGSVGGLTIKADNVLNAREKGASGSDSSIGGFVSSYLDDSDGSATILNDLYPLIDLKGGAIPTGGCIIAGGPNKGKTPAIKALVNAVESKYGKGSTVYIRFGEPIAGYLTSPSDLVAALFNAFADPEVRLIAIDSLKDIMGQQGGQLMARGIPRLFFVMFSQWSSIAASLGKSIVTPLNVSTDSEDAIAEVETACMSNATCTFTVLNSVKDRITYGGVARTGDGKPRASIVMNVIFDAKGDASISMVESTVTVAAPEDTAMAIKLSQELAISRAMTRHIKKNVVDDDSNQ